MLPTYKINEAEFLQCRVPEALIPKFFKGILLIVPTDLDQDRMQVVRKDIDAVAHSVDHVATYRPELDGWILQQKGPRD